jgi:L-seryl-tRNA(Ser) seleniumtransferase
MTERPRAEQARHIPAVNTLAEELAHVALPRPLLVATIRRELDQIRAASPIPAADAIRERVANAARHLASMRIQPVVNATGVLLHTNLGRAPLGVAVAEELAATAVGYSSVEMDLTTGERGRRGLYVERCLATLFQADAALVVNNCAAALVLTIAARLAHGPREVVVSRGELVQIGGGFRIPEIIAAAGATLREVGTTNQTTIADYAAVVGEHTALLLAVHRSNFAMQGFVAAPQRTELARLGAAHGVPLVVDLGSGAAFPTDQVAEIPREPMPSEVLAQGASLVCFSGDKLLGGPQAGVIAGARALVDGCRNYPLYRAVRCGKLNLIALQQTIERHLTAPEQGVQLQQLLGESLASLRGRATAVAATVADATAATSARAAAGSRTLDIAVVDCASAVGGGTLPTVELGSICLAIRVSERNPEKLLADLRSASPPIIGRIADARVLLDLRTVLPEQDRHLGAAIKALVG